MTTEEENLSRLGAIRRGIRYAKEDWATVERFLTRPDGSPINPDSTMTDPFWGNMVTRHNEEDPDEDAAYGRTSKKLMRRWSEDVLIPYTLQHGGIARVLKEFLEAPPLPMSPELMMDAAEDGVLIAIELPVVYLSRPGVVEAMAMGADPDAVIAACNQANLEAGKCLGCDGPIDWEGKCV